MNINDLFCTPEQGKRLADLVPELTSVFVWAWAEQDEWIIHERVDVTHGWDGYEIQPALTLQELRDVAKDHLPASDLITKFQPYLYNMSAPKLADWIIERLGVKL
jgi:hypothetical protein